MHVGALEARRWAGLVLSPSPGKGVGLSLAWETPSGERRELEDWHWMASRVGPHAPDGSYARMEFDLGAAPDASSAPADRTLRLEWARGTGCVLLRALASAPGRLEVVGDAPWEWAGRWSEGEVWEARDAGEEVIIAFAGEAVAGGALSRVEVGEGEAREIVLAACWGRGSKERALELRSTAAERIERARASWRERRPRSPAGCEGLLESIADQLSWMVLLKPESGQLYCPAGRSWIFPRPDRPGEPDDWTVFGWDSFFNALLLVRVNADLAWEALLAGVESRYPSGSVPNWRSRRGGTPDRSHPPLGSYAALRLYRATGSRRRLAEAYPGLLAWSEWWIAPKEGRPRREGLTPGLLSWGSDGDLVPERVPPWEEGAAARQRAAWESGQDDLPLWEEAEWDPEREVLAMSAVDLSSYRVLDLEALAEIARILGEARTAARLEAERRRVADAMNRTLWSDSRGLYFDELPGGRSTRAAASNFLPLLAGVPSAERAGRMAAALDDPNRFGGEPVIPTISRDDPAFPDQQYWRGSIWPPMNYLVLQGLRRYGFREQARELAWKGARMYMADQDRTGFCRENYDSRTGKGCGQRFQSWSPLLALGALEMAEEGGSLQRGGRPRRWSR